MGRTSMFGWSVIVGLSLLLIQSTPARANDPVNDAQDKLLARRAAEVDCYRKLAEAVYGVEITSNTYVRDFIAESDEIRAAVETFVKGVRLGKPRYYDDGTCEIDAEVTVANLVTKLTEIHAAYYKGNVVKSSDLTHLRETLRTNVIRVTGAGVPRSAMPPDLPEGIEDVLTPLPSGYVPPPMLVSPIWRAVGPQARLMAERAARVDAMRRLLERVKGLRLRSDTLVRDFLAESDEVSTRASGLVVGARQVGRYIHPDELIVEVTMELPLEKVVTRLSELHDQYYRGHHVSTTDITQIQKKVVRKTIRATGSGVAPQRFVNRLARDGIKMPPWIGKRLEATGSGTDKAMETAQGRLRAARAAELDGKRKLAEQVYGLHIDARTTVRDFAAKYDQVLAQMRAVLSDTITSEPIFEGDVATVTVILPAADVWSVVHQHSMILDRHH